MKLLGVRIDSKFKFTGHISTICKEASQRISVLMRLRNLIPTRAKLILFKSAVLPYFTYCHLVWHFCRCSDGRKLERLQERGLKVVYRDKHASYPQLLKRAELPTLLNRRLWGYLHPYVHWSEAQSISNLYHSVIFPIIIIIIYASYSLRQSDFSIPRYYTLTYGKHSLRCFALRLWRKLPPVLTSAKTLHIFKNRIRKSDISSMIDDGCQSCSHCSS